MSRWRVFSVSHYIFGGEFPFPDSWQPAAVDFWFHSANRGGTGQTIAGRVFQDYTQSRRIELFLDKVLHICADQRWNITVYRLSVRYPPAGRFPSQLSCCDVRIQSFNMSACADWALVQSAGLLLPNILNWAEMH